MVGFQRALHHAEVVYRWECNRLISPRGTILCFKIGKVMWRSDTQQKTTKKEMMDDGWVLTNTRKMEW